MADWFVYCLEHITDYLQFERLCHDLMAREGYRGMEPLGHFRDKGRDAIHVDCTSDKKVTIFAYTVRADWQKKLTEDAEKIKAHEHKCDRLVFVCTASFTAEQRDDAVQQIHDTYGWELQLYGRERLATLLRDNPNIRRAHPQLFPPLATDGASRSPATDANSFGSDERLVAGTSSDPVHTPGGSPRIRSSNYPITSAEFFGRELEVSQLDRAWQDSTTNVIAIVAFAGEGKSALVRHWLDSMAHDGFRGATHVFIWSFYRDLGESSAEFFREALRFFDNPAEASTGRAAELLVELMRRSRTLLVLDGLELLQGAPEEDGARLSDPHMGFLIRELTTLNGGLCVITTQFPVLEVASRSPRLAPVIKLEALPVESAVRLLKELGVKGAENDIMRTVEAVHRHALTLQLLGRYLRTRYGGDIGRVDELKLDEADSRAGGQARWVMSAYENWLGDGVETQVLRAVSFFRRPVPLSRLNVLLQAAIPNVSDQLSHLSAPALRGSINKLSQFGLLAADESQTELTVETHSLVLRWFSDAVAKRWPDAWKKGHTLLFSHLEDVSEENPSTLEGMATLYSAMSHACKAGRYQDALRIFRRKIHPDYTVPRVSIELHESNVAKRKFKALFEELESLRGLFRHAWDDPVPELSPEDQAYVLNHAGFRLRSLGRFSEASPALKAAQTRYEEIGELVHASMVASHLKGLYMSVGDLVTAAERAQHAVELAQRCAAPPDILVTRMSRLADVLHQMGRFDEAESQFRAAEQGQRNQTAEERFLFLLNGFQFCDLLLDQGKFEEVRERCTWSLRRTRREATARLPVVLTRLMLGKTHLRKFVELRTAVDLALAGKSICLAVEELRDIGQQMFMPLGLLARAELHRTGGQFDEAIRDLQLVRHMCADRRPEDQMRLHLAECHMEWCRTELARDNLHAARQSLAKAAELVESTGYVRRERAIAELRELSR
jgi:tetratricopeptide (TPR) repeat protein